jgi:hypothetical protein
MRPGNEWEKSPWKWYGLLSVLAILAGMNSYGVYELLYRVGLLERPPWNEAQRGSED